MVDTTEKLAFGPGRGLWQRIKDVALMDVALLVRGVDETSIEPFDAKSFAAGLVHCER